MRMWLVNPKKLCRQHLLGEHGEIHKAVGNLNHSGKWARALIEKGYLDPSLFKTRHDALAKEMISRGYNHKSPLNSKRWAHLEGNINKSKAVKELKSRCKNCAV